MSHADAVARYRPCDVCKQGLCACPATVEAFRRRQLEEDLRAQVVCSMAVLDAEALEKLAEHASWLENARKGAA